MSFRSKTKSSISESKPTKVKEVGPRPKPALPPKPRKKPKKGHVWIPHIDKSGLPIWKQAKLYEYDHTEAAIKSGTSATRRGKNRVKGRLRVSQPKGVRPKLKAIRAWIGARKHIESWRERDGSYHALVTFYGPSAWEQLDRAARKLPASSCYLALIGFFRTESQPEGGSNPMLILMKGKKKVFITPERTPTTAVSNWESGFEAAAFLRSFLFDGRDVFSRRAGLAVRWG